MVNLNTMKNIFCLTVAVFAVSLSSFGQQSNSVRYSGGYSASYYSPIFWGPNGFRSVEEENYRSEQAIIALRRQREREEGLTEDAATLRRRREEDAAAMRHEADLNAAKRRDEQAMANAKKKEDATVAAPKKKEEPVTASTKKKEVAAPAPAPAPTAPAAKAVPKTKK